MKTHIYFLICVMLMLLEGNTFSPDNICTFRTDGKLFTLTYLKLTNPYKIKADGQTTIYFNFCFYFVPPQCSTYPPAFSYVVTDLWASDDQEPQKQSPYQYKCQKYSMNSTTSLFQAKYEGNSNDGQLSLRLFTSDPKSNENITGIRQTQFIIKCSQRYDYFVEDFDIEVGSKLRIEGNSRYGCPVFQISSLWQVFQNHKIVFGILAFLLGFYLLFYGRAVIDITVFIAVFFISLAALGSILTIFISPDSSTITIYISFLILLFLSCFLGYGATKLISISVFFIGAFFGFIIGLLVSSIFSKMFDIYAEWVWIVFVLIFSIPLGLLTFKYHDDIIIASSSFTGAYLVVRPFSWLFGGFPNQFLLYEKVQAHEISSLPATFFVYLFFIIVLAVIGSMYQRLKLQRARLGQQIETNFIQQNIQAPIDAVKGYLDKIIGNFKSDQQAHEQYKKMEEVPLQENIKK